jgi:hypothetical protein
MAVTAVSVMLGLTLASPQAAAGDLMPPPDTEALHGEITLYGWYPSLDGKVGVNGFGPADIPDDGDTDILDVLDGFFMGNASLRYGAWGVFGDLVWADFGQSATSARGYASAEAEMSGLLGTAALTYALVDSPGAHLDALVGARIWSIDASLDLSLLGGAWDIEQDETISWVDPLVGLRGHYMVSESVFIAGAGAIGGFGVGSQLMWDASASVGYAFSNNFSASIGYRAIGADYSDDGDVIDITAYGPVAGITASF